MSETTADTETDRDDREARYLRRFSRSESLASVGRAGFKWGGLAYIALQAKQSIEALAGESTLADIGVQLDVGANLPLSTLIAWAVALIAVGYGLKQRELRRDSVERLQTRIQDLEKGRDPRRSSSGLTPRGTTRPEDEL